MNMHSGGERPDQSPVTDPELATALRAVYAAPADDGYWAGLEGRILSRLRQAEGPLEWWNVLVEWRVAHTAGLVAAGLMLTLAGFALWKERQIDQDLRKLAAGAAYWTVFDLESDDVNIAFTVPNGRSGSAPTADRHLFNVEP
jgi:anti-sigma-K factor RskA